MRIQSDYSHTWLGVFQFDLSIGILLAFIFHNIVRDSLFDNLPIFLKSRFSAFKQFEWNAYFKKNWLVVMISILIGAASHIVWDSFTHDHGYFVQIIPSLTNTFEILGREIPIFKILQHSSTVVGGLIIAFAIYKLPQDWAVIGSLSVKYWSIVVGLTFAIVALRLIGGLELAQYGNVIVTAIAAGLLSLTIAPLVLNKGQRY